MLCCASAYALTLSSYLRCLAHEATARVLHLAQSAAALGVMSRLGPLILRSFFTVYRHVSLRRPILLLHWGVHLRPVLVMELEGMRQTYPSHCHVCIISARVSIPVLFLSSSFEIVLGQYILRMCQRYLVWNTSSFCWIVTVVFQHSAPYGRMLNTLLLNILILVWTLRLAVLHTGFNMVKAWLALLILVLILWLQSPVLVTSQRLLSVFHRS